VSGEKVVAMLLCYSIYCVRRVAAFGRALRLPIVDWVDTLLGLHVMLG
jgi:hypothetical protein